VTRFAARRLGRCALSGAALLGLTLTTSDGNAAVRPPPDPRVAAATFVAACRDGLRDRDAFARAIGRSPLGFRLFDVSGTTRRYSGPMAIHLTPGERCTAHLRFFEQADIERFVEEVSQLTGLTVSVRELTGTAPAIRDYSWPDRAVSGGRVAMRGTVTAPDGVQRPEPQGFRLSFSASFVATE